MRQCGESRGPKVLPHWRPLRSRADLPAPRLSEVWDPSDPEGQMPDPRLNKASITIRPFSVRSHAELKSIECNSRRF